MFEKMLAKKGKKVSPVEQKAKKDVLSDLSGQASGMMGDKLGSLKKVSVLAPDEKGLKKGLDSAKELLSAMPEVEDQETADANYDGQSDDSHPAPDSQESGGETADDGDHDSHEEDASLSEESSEDPKEERSESPEQEQAEHDDVSDHEHMSAEELDHKISLLQELKHKKSGY